jgi:hypothetical protein
LGKRLICATHSTEMISLARFNEENTLCLVLYIIYSYIFFVPHYSIWKLAINQLNVNFCVPRLAASHMLLHISARFKIYIKRFNIILCLSHRKSKFSAIAVTLLKVLWQIDDSSRIEVTTTHLGLTCHGHISTLFSTGAQYFQTFPLNRLSVDLKNVFMICNSNQARQAIPLLHINCCFKKSPISSQLL